MPESNWEMAVILGVYMFITATFAFVDPWLAMAVPFFWLTGVAVAFLIKDPQ